MVSSSAPQFERDKSVWHFASDILGAAISTTTIESIWRRIAVPVFVAGWLAIAAAVLLFGWTPTWAALTVPTEMPPFSDMRSVQGAIDAVHHGLNPQVANPGDPWHRTMDYPIVWERIAERLHFELERDYLSFEIALVLAFLASVAGLLWRAPSPWLVAASFSSSVLLLVERGNNDLAVFSLVYLAEAVPLAIGLGVLFVAALLKLYPMLCWPALVRTRGTLVIAAVLTAIFMLLLRDELGAISRAQPMRAYLSYGSASYAYAFKVMGHVTVPGLLISAVLVVASLGALLLLVILLLSLNHSALGTWFGMAGYAVNELAKGVLFVLMAAVTIMVLVQDDVVLRLWQRLTLLPKLR